MANFCSETVCQNNGTCRTLLGAFECECVEHFEGRHCENIVDYCSPENCLNGGVCEPEFGGFTCICNEGFTGTNCEVVQTTTKLTTTATTTTSTTMLSTSTSTFSTTKKEITISGSTTKTTTKISPIPSLTTAMTHDKNTTKLTTTNNPRENEVVPILDYSTAPELSNQARKERCKNVYCTQSACSGPCCPLSFVDPSATTRVPQTFRLI